MVYAIMTDNTKDARMQIRLDAPAKDKLERAAAYTGKSLSAFVLAEALTAADAVLQAHETLALRQADWQTFLNALDNPPAPNDALQRAMAAHKKHVTS